MTATAHIQSESVEQTMQIAGELAKRLRGGDIIALEGELGSGKTVFVRGLAQAIGVNPAAVSSPTFVICQEYASDKSELTLVHIDAYRLRGFDELETIGWNEIINDPDAIVAVEWPSRIAEALPTNRVIAISFEHAGEQSRALTISMPPGAHERLHGLAWPSSPPKSSIKCRTCGVAIPNDSPHLPFCSSRCRMADLGKWFSEDFRVSRPMEADDELDE